MKYAMVSDIHANQQAWDAISKDSELVRADAVVCLGDIVGYGPRPAEVLESVCSRVSAMILGDHESVVSGRLDAGTFSDEAQKVIEWTRSKLSSVAVRLFSEMDYHLQGDDFIVCHAQADEPELFRYVRTPEDVRPSLEAYAVPLIFAGHTHVPGVFVRDDETGKIEQASPVEFIVQPGKRYFVNVGSVGDPVHGQLLGSYCLYDSDTRHVMFRFVPFDVASFRRDVSECGIPVVPNFLRPKSSSAGAGGSEELAIQTPLQNPSRRSGPIRYVSSEELQDTSRTIKMKSYDSPLLRCRGGTSDSSKVSSGLVGREGPSPLQSLVGSGATPIVIPPAASVPEEPDVTQVTDIAEAVQESNQPPFIELADNIDSESREEPVLEEPDAGVEPTTPSEADAKPPKSVPARKIIGAVARKAKAKDPKKQAQQDAIRQKLRERQAAALARRKEATGDEQK